MPLEKIQIRNVGTNEKLDVALSPQVTTIVGKSYIGKSWLLRALRLVALNKPAGDSYINWDDDKNIAKVRLSIDGGKKVMRTRGHKQSVNSYKLSGKKKPYTAFGNSVPKDIAELLNLSEINFQGQHSTKENRIPFWFCETAGEVSRQLNSIVNLELIDKTLANIDSKKRKTNTVIELTEKALAKAIQEKKDLLYVEDLDKDLKNVERLQKRYEQDVRDFSTINEKVQRYINIHILAKRAGEQASDGLKAISVGKSYLKIADSTERLYKLVESGQDSQNILKNKPPSFQPLERLKEKNERINKQVYLLDTIIEDVENRRIQKCQTEKILKTLTKELEETVGKRCPLCGRPMVQKKKK